MQPPPQPPGIERTWTNLLGHPRRSTKTVPLAATDCRCYFCPVPHDTALIALIAVGLVLAFIGGYAASRLHLPLIVGYLLAGIAVGPFTPGFVGDPKLASQLAEIGVILLMFGVGMHFSVRDLWNVRSIALPGAVARYWSLLYWAPGWRLFGIGRSAQALYSASQCQSQAPSSSCALWRRPAN